jgi:hypothetical protein
MNICGDANLKVAGLAFQQSPIPLTSKKMVGAIGFEPMTSTV